MYAGMETGDLQQTVASLEELNAATLERIERAVTRKGRSALDLKSLDVYKIL